MWRLENWQKILQNFRMAVFQEVTPGLFTFTLSLLAVHELRGRSFKSIVSITFLKSSISVYFIFKLVLQIAHVFMMFQQK